MHEGNHKLTKIVFTNRPGSVAEWSKALVLGTSHFDGVGSNPTAAIPFFFPQTCQLCRWIIER